MIDATFVQKILDISDVEVKIVDGRPMASRQMYEIDRSMVKALTVFSLQSLVDYLTNNVDGLVKANLMCHVVSPKTVKLIARFDDIYREREIFIHAEACGVDTRCNRFVSQEEFILDLATMYVPDENTAALMQIVSNVKSEDVRLDEDDGVSQVVTSRSGVARLANVILPNPITLRPFRTFAEVEQPEDYFIFRARKGKEGDAPTFGLFKNGSGMWELKAVEAIKTWLGERLPEVAVIG